MTGPARVITLLTDYGLDDAFVGVCHGVIARICPSARIIDITHGIGRHDVPAGALTLADSMPFMPVGVHVAVVDPGVGSARRAVALHTADGRRLVGPDNGLLWPAALVCGGAVAAVDISESAFRLQPVSATFHGRDVFCPVAAQIAAGRPFDELGQPLDPASLVRLELPVARLEDGVLVATVLGVDGFGNAQLSATRELAARLALERGNPLVLRIASGEPQAEAASGAPHAARYARVFADGAPGELLVYVDSTGRLAIAVNAASAAARLGLRVGLEVTIAPVPDRPGPPNGLRER